jgi:hypothetical protein
LLCAFRCTVERQYLLNSKTEMLRELNEFVRIVVSSTPLGGRGCAPGIISRQGGEMSEKEFAVFLKTIFGLLAEHAISYSRWRRSGCGWRITTRWNNSDRLRRPFAHLDDVLLLALGFRTPIGTTRRQLFVWKH